MLTERGYRTDSSSRIRRRSLLALKLLDAAVQGDRSRYRVVAGPTYGANKQFLGGLTSRGFGFLVEVRPSTRLVRIDGISSGKSVPARSFLRHAKWQELEARVAGTDVSIPYQAADLGKVLLGNVTATLVAAQTGGIPGLHRGTVFILCSIDRHSALVAVLERVGWARWIRPTVRRKERHELHSRQPSPTTVAHARQDPDRLTLAVRANIQLSRRQDQSTPWERIKAAQIAHPGGLLFGGLRHINVVELFAGAGGMGLGFLLAESTAARYRVLYSAEANPIYARTLRINHETLARIQGRHNNLPPIVRPVDLRTTAVLKEIKGQARAHGGVHLLIGGPPCQGFSTANRNSWHYGNPHNSLVSVFLRYVAALRPSAFLMENVQGMLWTPRSGNSASVVAHLQRRFASLGYLVFPKLLDAVWYGVPQHRNRFFLLGLRTDLGYTNDHFGDWGPFPLPTHGPGTGQPYVTVEDAIADLPRIPNGEQRELIAYCKPDGAVSNDNSFLRLMRCGSRGRMISDHVTSKHADYVIARYRAIAQGANWEAIADKLTNYTAVERTHSNIYRRLRWNEPAITIGHYRKSMLVHPAQHRGLSLREASRLQSFPDWFRFAGSTNGTGGGLVHKQQQLANAVCPLVTKAIAEFLLGL